MILITESNGEARDDRGHALDTGFHAISLPSFKDQIMSRRGIHPLLMGLDRPKRTVVVKPSTALTGLESGQRKRYLRAEAAADGIAAQVPAA